MKRILTLSLFTLLVAFSLSAAENEVKCKFKPHFQVNLDLKALATGHIIHKGDFFILHPYGKSFDFDMPAGGPGIEALLGCRLKEWLFIGGGLSLEWWFNADSRNLWSYEGPFTLDRDKFFHYGMGWATYAAPRFYIPTRKKDITPYFDLGIGFCQFFLMMDDWGENQYVIDWYCHAGAGVDIHRFNISAGYQYSYNSNGYLRIGYRF